MQLWSSRHHHSGLVALCLTEPGHPAEQQPPMPRRVRVVDADVAATAEAFARADAEAAKAAGRPLRIDLDQLVRRATTQHVGPGVLDS